jgi:membrane-bound ClpP family serine protease
MLIFAAIAVAAFIVVTGSFFFGGDHDGDHDHGDAGHDVGHGLGEPTISIFSAKIIGTLIMGFGIAGAISTFYGLDTIAASVIGLAAGASLGGVMYLALRLLYRQQASSLVATSSTVGCTGTVTVSIGEGAIGEVGLSLEGQYLTYSAGSKDGKPIRKGATVRVVRTMGSHLVVEEQS